MPRRWRADDEYQIIHDLLEQQRGHGAALASTQVPQAYKDTLTVAATPQTTMQLTYVPMANSIDLKWNGQGTIEGVDYSVDYTTGIVTFLSPLQTLLRATPAPADVVEAEYWTTGDLIAFSSTPDTGGAGLRGQGGATGTGVTSITITLDHAVQPGDTVVVVGYFNGGPGAPTISGLGATWTNIHPSNIFVFIGVGVTAGLTAITVSYPFAENFTAVAAAISNLGGYIGTATNTVGPTTIDVPGILNGSIVGNPTAGQSVVATWTLNTSVTGGPTTSFTDSNGTYTQITSQAGNTWLAELGFATVPASGATDHTGTRGDSASGTGFALLFDAA